MAPVVGELRFVLRGRRRILQQAVFVEERFYGDHVEWVDVPLVDEATELLVEAEDA